MFNLASFELAVSFGVKAHTFTIFCAETTCEAHSNDARDAKRMAQGRAGGAKSA